MTEPYHTLEGHLRTAHDHIERLKLEVSSLTVQLNNFKAHFATQEYVQEKLNSVMELQRSKIIALKAELERLKNVGQPIPNSRSNFQVEDDTSQGTERLRKDTQERAVPKAGPV
jgi:hypothetical protein